MKNTDPTTMAPAARIAELADLLAAGFQRLRARKGKPAGAATNPQDPLDDLATVEAPCAPMHPEAP